MVNLKKVLIEVAAWVVIMLYFWSVVLPQFALSLWSEAVYEMEAKFKYLL
jgi:hypothetical protein